MLDSRPSLGFNAIAPLLNPIYTTGTAVAPMRQITRVRRDGLQYVALLLVCRVAPHAGLVVVQEARQRLAVVHIRRSGHERVNDQIRSTDVETHCTNRGL